VILISNQKGKKLLACNLCDKIQALTKAYWRNQCPECGNDLSIAFCEDCEQDLSEPSIWIELVDIVLDNFY
jgi:predicted RNA-binding Zn-ribbon protein involved in translation (DUF1610 family)